MKNLEPSFTADGNAKCCNFGKQFLKNKNKQTKKKRIKIPKKKKITHSLAILFLGIYPREINTYVYGTF